MAWKQKYPPIKEGDVFGRLTVISFKNKVKNNKHWFCKCSCGNLISPRASSLNVGQTKSCGCYKYENLKTMNITHGLKKTSEYRIWVGMLNRCRSKKSKCYHNYGGRGITVSESWYKFENFYADMGKHPVGMSLDREDNDKGYSKENCRWATQMQQSRNTRNNIWVIVNGQKMIITDAARCIGANMRSLYSTKKQKTLTHQEVVDWFILRKMDNGIRENKNA
jgi:hypothetical protein